MGHSATQAYGTPNGTNQEETQVTARQLKNMLEKADITRRAAAKMIGISERQMYRFTGEEAPLPRSIEYALRWICANPEYRKT
jgi:hypothetical protein